LQPMIGGLNRVYEVLSKKRPLSLLMVRRLHAGLGISADCLIRETV
jgi:HTH-type transcriptional regulator / antitoxin HigA